MLPKSIEKSSPPLLILASASKQRLDLLQQIGLCPEVMPVDVDETPRNSERPKTLAIRLSKAKAKTARRMVTSRCSLILTADTVVSVGNRILPKAEDTYHASTCLSLLSGRGHRVYTGICLIGSDGRLQSRVVETRIRFKKISQYEMNAYIASKEWEGKAGGYAAQGIAGSFITKLVGSYPNVLGLPLFETTNLLSSAGYPIQTSWLKEKDPQ